MATLGSLSARNPTPPTLLIPCSAPRPGVLLDVLAPYFPPPPGPGGAPLPPPPGSAPAATHYHPPPNGQIQYQQAPSHQRNSSYGGYAQAPTPQPPAHYSHPASPQPFHAGTWPQPPHQAPVPHAYPTQQYAPHSGPQYQAPGAAPQMPPPGGYPNAPSQQSSFQPFQNVYSNINNQVLSSVQEIKNKARSKFSQYLMQPGQQSPQFNNYGPSPPQTGSSSRPVSVHSMSHGSTGFQAPPQHHHAQASPYQYGVPHAASPPPVQTSSPQQYGHFAPPPQQQVYQHPQAPVRTASYPTYQHPVPHAYASPPPAAMEQHLGPSPASSAMPTPSPSYPASVPTRPTGTPDYFAVPNAQPVAAVSSRPVSQHFQEVQQAQELPLSHAHEADPVAQRDGHSRAASSVNANQVETSQPRLVRTASGSYRILPQGSDIQSQIPQQTYPQPPAAAESFTGSHQQPQQVASQGLANISATANEEAPPAYVAVETPNVPPTEPPAPQATPGIQPIVQEPRTDPHVENISSQLGSMTLQQPASNPKPLTLEDEDFHDWKRPVPTITHDGKPSGVIWECPEKRVIDYESDWYHLPDIPDFLVCTRCHERYLSQTPLSSSFECVSRPTGRCRFNVPRVTRCLLPEYVKTKDAQPLKAFMASRLQIQDCHGEGGVNGAAGVKWFKVLDERLEGIVACEACYEDAVLGTSFAPHFATHDQAQPADATWACDVCLPFLLRTLVKHSRLPQYTWDDWAQSAAKHVKLPKCDGKPVEPTSRRWLRLRGGRASGILYCERCYEESLAFTPLGLEFELVDVEPSRTGLGWMDVALGYTNKEPQPMQCSAPSPPVLVATALARSRGDAGVLLEAAELIAACPPCTEAGITDGAWYTLAGVGGCDGYMLCAACHAGYVRAWGLERLFQRVTGLDSSVAYLCSFQRTAPRWLGHMLKMQEGVETGAWARYEGWVRRFSGVPECAREEQVGGRRWYGWDDCTICPECWLTHCKEVLSAAPAGVAKGLDMEFDGRLVTETRMCCMYSPRMRQKWAEAVDAGGASALVEFSRQRHGVYVRTVLQ
ncbi:integral membrane protein, partial [Colletotrichum musicola]